MSAALFLLSKPIVGIFIKPENVEMTAMAVHAMNLFTFAFLTHWISLAIQSFMTASGKSGYATAISISVSLVFPLLFLFALRPLGLNGLWLNLPLTALLGAILAVVLLTIYYKHWRSDHPQLNSLE